MLRETAAGSLKCQIWDTGGQERFSKIRPLYYRGALGCVIVFDVTNFDSFSNLEHWFGEVKMNCKNIPIILVGNKIDLDGRQVTKEAGRKFATQKTKELGYKIPYLETSAKTGETIKKVFQDLVEMMVEETEKAISERDSDK